MYANFSGCQNFRGGVKTQVLHPRNQLNPARVSYPATQTRLWHNLLHSYYFNMSLIYITYIILMMQQTAIMSAHLSASVLNSR